jgi:hypothetical protein
MQQRALMMAVVAALFGSASAAHAAPGSTKSHPPKNCGHLIVDRRGDANAWFLPTRPYNAEAALLYLDATSSAHTVDFTITMASVSATPTTGTTVTVYFHTSNQGRAGDWYVNVDHNLDGTVFGLQNNITNQVTPLTGAVNPTSHTFVVHVPRTAITATYRGAVLSSLGVIVSQTVGTTGAHAGFIEQSTGDRHQYRTDYGYGCQRSRSISATRNASSIA